MRPRYAYFAAVLMLGGLLSACAVTSGDGQRLSPRSEAFGDYVEAVFRRQNEVATDLALALDDENPDGERYRLLEKAELDLLTACRGLNQLAVDRRAGGSRGGLGALRRARQAPECETATIEAVALLD